MIHNFRTRDDHVYAVALLSDISVFNNSTVDNHMAGALRFFRSLRAKASCAKIISIVLLTLGTTSAAPSSGSELWTNPCSNHQVRHVRSTAERELKTFITTLNKDMFKSLKDLYPKNLKKIKGNCPRLNRLIEPIKQAPNISVAHQKFHLSMLEFALFLDKLKDVPIKTNTKFNFAKRQEIYEKTKNFLRLAICEFNETLLNEFKVKPYTSKAPKANTRCLPKEADLSKIQMLDMQFFKKLKRFLKLGKKILQKQKKNSKSNNSDRAGALKRTKS